MESGKIQIPGQLKTEVPSFTFASRMESMKNRGLIFDEPQEWQSAVLCRYPIYILSRWSNRFSLGAETNGISHLKYVVEATLYTDRPLSQQIIPIGIIHTHSSGTKPLPKYFKKALGSRYKISDNQQIPECFKDCTQAGCGKLFRCIENESGTIAYIDNGMFTVYGCPTEYTEQDDMIIPCMIEWAKKTRNGGKVSDFLGILSTLYLQHRRNLEKNELLDAKRQPIPRSAFNTAVGDTSVDIVDEISGNTEVLAHCLFKHLHRIDVNDLLRIGWSHMNPMRTGLHANLPESVLTWKKQIQKMCSDYCAEHGNIDLEDLKNICDFAVVAHSQEQKDEQSFELGARLFDGGYCIPEIFLDSLKYCTFTELYEELSAVFKFSSMQQQKAIAQISSHVLTFFAYGGKQPLDKNLLGYFQIWLKKFNILSAVAKDGAYIGPGWDRHVLRFAACHLPVSYSGYSEEFLEDLLQCLDEYPGGFMNEVIANLGQIMDRGSSEAKAVMEEVFEEAISIRPQIKNGSHLCL